MATLKILHTGDIQVKCREEALFRSYNRNLKDIEFQLVQHLIDIYVIDGDLFEYATPNDAERKLIYNHLARVLALPNIKEVVLMAGNHDLVKDNKSLTGQESENAINTFVEFMLSLNNGEASKLTYLKNTQKYISKVDSRLGYLAYSLEDDWNGRKLIEPDQLSPSTVFDISFYHDILKEYIDQVKLPIKKEKYNSILSINDFASNLIIGADIHKNWKYEDLNGRTFQYCGSSIQRNFGEGSEINLDGKSYPAERKVAKLYEIKFSDTDDNGDLNGPLVSLSDTPLRQFIAYNNIVFGETPAENSIVLLQHKLQDIEFGEEQTFIKIKLSNLYISLEPEIMRIVGEHCADKKRVSIEAVYDKFVNIGGIGDSKTRAEIKAIFDGVESSMQEPSESDESAESAESTTEAFKPTVTKELNTLDDDKLRKLFSVALNIHLETVKKEFGDIISVDDLKDEILTIFGDELTDSMGKISKYAHDYGYIECNAFMALGPNRIQLDIPGITRITGTNGIGKTTLHSMIRWVVRDEVFEGMSKANKVKNTLFAFNDKMPNIDEINVLLSETINGTHVTINRIAKRTWNKDTTDEQKASLYWKSFIAGVERKLIITVHKVLEDGTLTKNEYTGDQAERLLETWFGSTIENIQFLNAAKIAQLLKMPSVAMTELILDYVGIDYLRKLEENLPSVMLRLNKYAKPTKTRESFIDTLTTLRNDLLRATAELELLKTEVNNFGENITANEQQIALENAEQLKTGDVPSLITVNKTNQTATSNLIATFVPKDIKPKVPFDVASPVEQSYDDLTKSIEDANIKIESIKESIITVNASKTEAFGKLIDKYNKVVEVYRNKKSDVGTSITEIQTQIANNKNSIIKNNNEILSGKCEKCQRAFDANYDAHKDALIAENQRLDQLNSQLADSIIPLNETSKNYDKIIIEYTGYLNIASKHSIVGLPENVEVFALLINDCRSFIGKLAELATEQSTIESNIKSNETAITTIKQNHINALTEYNKLRDSNVAENNKIELENIQAVEHNKKIDGYKTELTRLELELKTLELQLPKYEQRAKFIDELKAGKLELETQQKTLQASITGKSVAINNINNSLVTENAAYENFINYSKNKLIGDIYGKLVKRDFKDLVFQFYRNFLNNTLNILLEDINFKLFWNTDNELYMVDMKGGSISYRPVQAASGMEMAFLGLSLIYAIHTLNVRNSLSNLLVDEISGVLNKGEELSYSATNYQEQMVLLLSKFTNIRVYIVDHVIANLFETSTYEVGATPNGSKFRLT